MQNNVYIDEGAALGRMQGNKGLYQRLLQSFISDPLMDSLIAEVERGDARAAAKTAHAIKGASANLSLMQLSESIRLLETELKAGNCDSAALQACREAFDKTKEAVNELVKGYESTKM